jgi:hypothetical protein
MTTMTTTTIISWPVYKTNAGRPKIIRCPGRPGRHVAPGPQHYQQWASDGTGSYATAEENPTLFGMVGNARFQRMVAAFTLSSGESGTGGKPTPHSQKEASIVVVRDATLSRGGWYVKSPRMDAEVQFFEFHFFGRHNGNIICDYYYQQ